MMQKVYHSGALTIYNVSLPAVAISCACLDKLLLTYARIASVGYFYKNIGC